MKNTNMRIFNLLTVVKVLYQKLNNKKNLFNA